MAGVMEKVVVDKRRQLWERMLGKEEKLMVQRMSNPTLSYTYSSEKARTHACSDVYVNCRPESSWEHLTSLLYEKDELTAMDQARLFLPPRGKLYTLMIVTLST